MNVKIKKALASGESETVEFKAGFLTVEKLLKGNYISNARNKKIADAFKAAGLIEKYGSGIRRILNAFKTYGLPAPRFEETSGGFMVTVYKKTREVTPQVTPQVKAILKSAAGEVSASSLQRAAGLKDRMHFLKTYLLPMIECGWLERTIPDKPRSRMQKYRLTAEGKKQIKKMSEK